MPSIETNPFEILSNQISDLKEQVSAIGTANQKPIEIIDRTELMKRLAVTEPTIIRWTKRGKIPEIKIGTSCRYNWYSVIEKLELETA